MRFLSVCSGIEAASVAWKPLGWKAHAFSEIEAFPSAVLAHHYPGTPNWGDMTKFAEWPDADVDVLVGGTPCQSFSVAGLRKGMADPRGNLALTFLAIAAKYAPRWICWENVPGVLSSEQGRDFGAFLGGLGQCGYGWAYRVLDAQYFGVPQRRRRVFVVGHLGDWRCAAAVLFERHSLQGNPAPRREKGQAAPTIPSRSTAGGGLGTDFDCDGGLIEAFGGNNTSGPIDVATACQAHGGPHGRQDFGSETFLVENASEDGTGRGTPLVPVPFDTTQITSAANYSRPKAGDPCHPLAAGAHPPAVCFTAKDHGADASDISPTLRSGSHSGSHANGGVMPAVAIPINTQIATRHNAMGRGTGFGVAEDGEPAFTLQSAHSHAVGTASAVRRLTPRECERLQGFPDDYTLVPYRGKPAADGPRYKALGNSFAVPVVRWIGQRIQRVEDLTKEQRDAA